MRRAVYGSRRISRKILRVLDECYGALTVRARYAAMIGVRQGQSGGAKAGDGDTLNPDVLRLAGRVAGATRSNTSTEATSGFQG